MENAGLPYFVAVGASGSEGLRDITTFLRALPRSLPAVVMVVLHRPSDQVSSLRDVLARSCDLPVVVAEDAEAFEPGTCYIGEPDGHLTLVARNLAHLVPGEHHRFRNRTIDVLFTSLSIYAGKRVIGIVMSGALDDGSRGLAAIHDVNGLTMVLDPERKTRGMQQNAIDFDGPISFIGTAREIASVVTEIVGVHQR
jgi:two-component system chemotaxis response regulator CheB